MKFRSSLNSFLSYVNDSRRLPLDPFLIQIPSYVLSYLEGRLAERGLALDYPRRFSFRLNRKLTVWLKPDQFGMAKGILEDREYADLALSSKPKYILDLGANVGLGLLAMHDEYPHAQLAGVEADPRNFSLLMRNLAANNLQVSLIAAAVSGEGGLLSLRVGRSSTCSTLINGNEIHPGHTASIEVPVLTMHQILERLGWTTVDLLKVDIEGAEESLFAESAHWLKDVKAIIMEIHPNTTPERIQAYLAPYGFRLQRKCYGREPVYFADRPGM